MKKQKTFHHMFALCSAVVTGFLLMAFPLSVHAVNLSADTRVTVGATYYGGEFRDDINSWVIDNVNQCQRIANGEFTAASLDAVVDDICDDDNGLSYQGPPLHNTVSFAELSNNPANPDYAALGNLPAGTKVEIEYQGRCVVAEKRDIGQGGGPINGQPRAIDLWWQTARSLNFKNGYDTMTLRLANASQPFTPLGSSVACQTASPATTPPANPVTPPANTPPSSGATTPTAPATNPATTTTTPASTPQNTNDSTSSPQAHKETSKASDQALARTSLTTGPDYRRLASYLLMTACIAVAAISGTQLIKTSRHHTTPRRPRHRHVAHRQS